MGGAADPGDQDFSAAGEVDELRCRGDAEFLEQRVEAGHLVVADGEAEVSEFHVCLGAAAEVEGGD